MAADGRTIFHCESFPDSPIFTLDAPAVKGLVIHCAGCGTFKFYAAWVEWSGTFILWLKVQPAIEDVDSDYAVGEVLGRPVFNGITIDLSGHDAIDMFSTAWKNVAWDLGVDEE